MNDPVIHLLVGAQYGDLEYDVGKSVRWSQYYCDFLHVTDVNLGTQRYWVVNWAMTFPEAMADTTGINFFARPVDFRKEQWRLANDNLQIGDDDWILWVDAHEGMSFDNTSLPNDYLSSPFRSWVYREVTRAETAGRDYAVIPFYVFCESSELQNVEFLSSQNDAGAPTTYQTISVPTYVDTNQGLVRLMKASRLRNAAFNWTTLDQLQAWIPTGSVPAVKMQIISYAYAHWQNLDIVDPEVGIPDLSESNDEGWKMRKLIAQVRPIAGFPVVTWNPNDQPAGLPGPWAVDAPGVTDPDLADDLLLDSGDPTPANVKVAGLRTPLYDNAFRVNLRDGVWYEEGLSGNIPLSWDTANQEWVTTYDPATWADEGIKSSIYDPVPEDPPSVPAS